MTSYQRIYAVVRRIPRGRVATYGQVAALAGIPGHARQVGYALHALPAESGVPWHRVINARGEISLRALNDNDRLQRMLLVREGVRLSREGKISLDHYRWRPRGERLLAEDRE
jgi:methylated-DNA-protein-cysteine methyltransferase-like protein